MKRLGKVGHCLSVIVGAGLGTFAFLVLGVILTGKPIQQELLSAHGILVTSKPTELTAQQSAVIADLLQKGALISSSDLLSNVSSFYSTTIQVLIAMFFVFGVLSFFAVQANARRQIEEIADASVTKAAISHFASTTFDRQINQKIDSSMQVELEGIDKRFSDVEELGTAIEELEARVKELQETVQPQKSEDE